MKKSNDHTNKEEFSLDEDFILVKLVRMFGFKKWKVISTYYDKIFKEKNKTSKDLKDRWTFTLENNSEKPTWNIAEEYIFFESRNTLGNKWALISKVIPGRSDNDIKNHFYGNLRKTLRKFMKNKIDNSLCIYEKIRTFYFFIYIKSKFNEFLKFYDEKNNSIDYESIKKNAEDLISNVDDKLISEIVIENKGSFKRLNDHINSIGKQIIQDPETWKIIKDLSLNKLDENLKLLSEFEYEKFEDQNLISLIIKLHVYNHILEENKIFLNDSQDKESITDIGTNKQIQSKNLEKDTKNKHETEYKEVDLNQETKINKENEEDNCSNIDNNMKYLLKNNKLTQLDNLNLIENLKSKIFKEYKIKKIITKENCEYLEDFKIQKDGDFCENNNYENKNRENLINNIIEKNKKEIIPEKYIKQNNNNKHLLNDYNQSNAQINKKPEQRHNDIDNNYQRMKDTCIINNIGKKFNTKLKKIEYNEVMKKFLESNELKHLLRDEIQKNQINGNEDELKERHNNKKLINKNKIEKSFNLENKKSLIEKLKNFSAANNNVINKNMINKILKENNEKIININKLNIENKDSNLFYKNKFNYSNFIDEKQTNDFYHETINKSKFQNFQNLNNVSNSNFFSFSYPNIVLNNNYSSSNLFQNFLNVDDSPHISNFNGKDEKNSKINKNYQNYYNKNQFENKEINEIKIKEYKKIPDHINNAKNENVKSNLDDESQNSSEEGNLDNQKLKYTTVDEENLQNTNSCFISHNMLEKLMNLKDPDIFLNIIEKIVVNNIVYSIFSKEKFIPSNIIQKNSAYFYNQPKDSDLNLNLKNDIDFNNIFNNCSKNNNVNVNYSSFKNESSNTFLEDEKYFSKYNKIKGNHHINSNSIPDNIENKEDILSNNPENYTINNMFLRKKRKLKKSSENDDHCSNKDNNTYEENSYKSINFQDKINIEMQDDLNTGNSFNFTEINKIFSNKNNLNIQNFNFDFNAS